MISQCELQGFNLLHLSVQSSPLFVYFYFLCLQVSLVSNFCPDTRGRRWSLIQAHLFSCVVGREEHCKQISLACVENAHSVQTTLGLPQLTAACAFPVYTAQAPRCSAGHCPKWTLCFMYFPGLSCSGSVSRVLCKGTDLAEHVFCALPSSEQLRQPGAWRAHSPDGAVHLSTSLVPAPRFPGCSAGAPSQVCPVSPLGS